MAATTVESLGLVKAVCARCREETFVAQGQRTLCAECGTTRENKKRPNKVHKKTRIDGTAHIGAWPKRVKR